MATTAGQEVYEAEYTNCMHQPNVTSSQCSGYALCVANSLPYYPITLGDCTTGTCQPTSGNTVSPASEYSCWQQYLSATPPTYPSVPVDTGNEDPPTSTDPPPQYPPCDPYYDCKTTKTTCTII